MSIGLRTREQLSNAARYSPRAPRTRQDAGIHDGDIYDGPSIGDALLSLAALLSVVGVASVVLWALVVLLFSVDERAPIDVTSKADAHWQVYQDFRSER